MSFHLSARLNIVWNYDRVHARGVEGTAFNGCISY